jgi:hypothetical protein
VPPKLLLAHPATSLRVINLFMKFVKLTIDGADVVKFGTKYHLVKIEAKLIMVDFRTS